MNMRIGPSVDQAMHVTDRRIMGFMNDFLRTFLQLLFSALYIAIIGRALISFIDPQGRMRATQILNDITEPILGPLRRVLPSIGFLDISPLVALLLLNVLRTLVLSALQ
jgi:YggT family protein